MGFRNRGPKGRSGGKVLQLGFVGVGERLKRRILCSKQIMEPHTHLPRAWRKNQERSWESLFALCNPRWLASPLSLLYIDLQTCIAWFALHCCFGLRLSKDLDVVYKSIKDFFRTRCHHSPADNAALQLHLRPCGLLRRSEVEPRG